MRSKLRVKFSIRILLVLIAIAAIPLAWVSNQARIANRETATLEEFGDSLSSVWYDYHNEMGNGEPNGPKWLRQVFGKHVFSRVIHLCISDPQPDDLRRLAAFEKLTILEIHAASSLENLKEMPPHDSVVWLDLFGGNLKSLDGIEGLKNLGTLKVFDVKGLEGFATTKSLQHLAYLELRHCDIESLSSFAGMEKLKTVFLYRLSKLNDIEALVALPKLEIVNGDSLDLITPEKIESLRERLPDCKVFENL